MALIVSVSGVRGIVGSELTPEISLRFAAALGSTIGPGPFAIGRDSRPSGTALALAATAGLLGVGCSVIDLGIVPTPTCGFLVRELGCVGGLMITASHNPAPYNGLKLFGPDGAVLSPQSGRRIQATFESGTYRFAGWDACGQISHDHGADQRHIDRVLSLLDVVAIRDRQFRIVLDANGGAGGPLALSLLSSLGCRVVAIGCTPDGAFRHEPEPTPSNLTDVAKIVRATAGAFGLALDPDSDRLALIDESANCLSEEVTLALAVQERLHQSIGPVAINLSTSSTTADVVVAAGAICHRSAVGEANVVTSMRQVAAIIGGEGNGGVIDPRVGWVRDPFIGIGLILSRMARTQSTLQQLVNELPHYVIRKDKFPLSGEHLNKVMESLVRRWPEAVSNRTDGLRLAWPDRWVHIRGSNTEPVVRVIAEARLGDDAELLCLDVQKTIKEISESF